MLRCIPLALLVAIILTAPAGACRLKAKGPFDGAGRPHGEWRIMHCDGTEASGQFWDGGQHGARAIRHLDGRTGDWGYANGRKDGTRTYRYPDGSRVHGEGRACWKACGR